MTAPPAEGVRVDWESVPEPVRIAIEHVCGSPVVKAKTQAGGFSPGVAARLVCGDGTRRFVKAVSADANPQTPALHRREAQILQALDTTIGAADLPVPRLQGVVESGRWTALVLEDVAGRLPRLPWEPSELAGVAVALDQLAEVLTPSPIATASLVDLYEEEFTGWRTLALAGGADGLDGWAST